MTKIHAYLLLIILLLYKFGGLLLNPPRTRTQTPLLDLVAAWWVLLVVIGLAVFAIETYFRLTATRSEEPQAKGDGQ